nr:hypothetical protein [Tanacetum cinerariifolium]
VGGGSGTGFGGGIGKGGGGGFGGGSGGGGYGSGVASSMAIEDNPPPPTDNMEKPFGVTNIKSHVPLVLDLDQLNYDACVDIWHYLHLLFANGSQEERDSQGCMESLADLFHDNKEARSMELQEELRSLDLGSLSIGEYFKKIKLISDLLTNVDSPISEKNLIMYAANGLSDKYEHIQGFNRRAESLMRSLQTVSDVLHENKYSTGSVDRECSQ